MSLLNSRHSILASRLKPARRGVWLLLGWLTFWLGTVAYPCQAHPGPDPSAEFEVAAGQIEDSGHLHPAHDNGTCHHVSDPVIGAPLTAATNSGNPNVDPVVPVTAEPAPLPAAVNASRIHPVSQSPPRTPLYLRTKRLLI